MTNDLPIATLWDPQICKKKRVLTLPTDKNIIADRYVCADFSFDSNYFVCVTGEPDWSLYCFKCETGRLDSYAKAINLTGQGTVLQVIT